MDGIKFDMKAMIDSIILSGIAKSKDPKSKQALAVMRVFQRHNIGVTEAMEIMIEMVAVCGEAGTDNG